MNHSISLTQARRWYWQRISAMVLAVCVLVHLAGIVYAVRGGLSAAEILGRTQGNWFLGLFYGIFVLACAAHVPAGIANILEEWLGWSGAGVKLVSAGIAIGILLAGWRAVFGLVSA